MPTKSAHRQAEPLTIDGKDATCPTAASDANGDGYIDDLVETEPTSGTTMLPFHAPPATLEIANDTYPVADKSGAAYYTHTDDVTALDKALKEKLKATGSNYPSASSSFMAFQATRNFPTP